LKSANVNEICASAVAMITPDFLFAAITLVYFIGVFTTGTQFKANFLQWTLRSFDQRRD